MANAASEAFRKCSADLIKVIQDRDLPILAWELYSAEAVSKSVKDEVIMGTSSVEIKKAMLLSTVGDQIDVNPTNFQNLLWALRKLPPLREVVDKLETTYKNCGM